MSKLKFSELKIDARFFYKDSRWTKISVNSAIADGYEASNIFNEHHEVDIFERKESFIVCQLVRRKVVTKVEISRYSSEVHGDSFLIEEPIYTANTHDEAFDFIKNSEIEFALTIKKVFSLTKN